MVEEATDGRLILDTKVDLFGATEIAAGVIDGRVDIGFQRIPFVSGTFPLWNFGALPFVFANIYEYESTLNDPRMIELEKKSYAEYGLVKLMESSAGPQFVWSQKPITTIDGFKGLKIRTSGVVQTETLRLLGAAPLGMPIVEIAEAVQRGTVDAIATAVAFGLGMGMADVTTHISLWPVSSVYGGAVVVNMDSWNALPADLQQKLWDVSRVWQAQEIMSIDIEYRITMIAARSAGMTLIVPEKAELDRARDLVKPVVDKWLEMAGPYGPEFLAVAADYASGADMLK